MKNRILKQLSPNHVKAIEELYSVNPDIILGGSLSLVYFGLLNRNIQDLDIFVYKESKFSTSQFMIVSDELETSDFTTDFNGEIIDRTAFAIKKISVCCFKMNSIYLDHTPAIINGLEVKIQNPCFAIAAKTAFQIRNSKHKKDLDYIFEKLKSDINEK